MDGFRALAEREDIDAVLVLSTQWFGALPILAACDAGKSVYCAAPLDFQPEQAQGHPAAGGAVGSGVRAPSSPDGSLRRTLRLKELIATRLGPPRLLFCHQRTPTEAPDGRAAAKAAVRADARDGRAGRLVSLRRGATADFGAGIGARRARIAHDKDYEMMSLDFAAAGGRAGQRRDGPDQLRPVHAGLLARGGHAIGRRRRCRWPASTGVAFIDLPSTLVWFDKAGRHMESLDSERPVGEQLLNQFHRSVTSLIAQHVGPGRRLSGHVDRAAGPISHAEGRRVPLAAVQA